MSRIPNGKCFSILLFKTNPNSSLYSLHNHKYSYIGALMWACGKLMQFRPWAPFDPKPSSCRMGVMLQAEFSGLGFGWKGCQGHVVCSRRVCAWTVWFRQSEVVSCTGTGKNARRGRAGSYNAASTAGSSSHRRPACLISDGHHGVLNQKIHRGTLARARTGRKTEAV